MCLPATPRRSWRGGRTPAGSRAARRDPRYALLDLYLPICSATAATPITVGHLGQSLDGFIATHAGDSQFVTGEENILHLHRMRALCDAVIVGAGTVAADDPQLTTRRVRVRVRCAWSSIPRGGSADTIASSATPAPTLLRLRALADAPGESHFGRAAIVAARRTTRAASMCADLLRLLRGAAARACSSKAAASPCRRSSRPACSIGCRLPSRRSSSATAGRRSACRAAAPLRDCQRPSYRVFRMGGDVLFDCDLTAGSEAEDTTADTPPVSRII